MSAYLQSNVFFFYKRALSVKWGRFHLSRNVTGERCIKHIRCNYSNIGYPSVSEYGCCVSFAMMLRN